MGFAYGLYMGSLSTDLIRYYKDWGYTLMTCSTDAEIDESEFHLETIEQVANERNITL